MISNDLVKDIRSEVGSAEETGLADETLGSWIDEDENSFENAVLISELVTKNIGTRRTPATAAPAEARQTASAAANTTSTQTRRRPQSAPGIADMLDDMLSQQRDRR